MFYKSPARKAGCCACESPLGKGTDPPTPPLSVCVYVLGAAESLVSVQGEAVRGPPSSPADAKLHQPGDRTRCHLEEPQATHPGTDSYFDDFCVYSLEISWLRCVHLFGSSFDTAESPPPDCWDVCVVFRASFRMWCSLSCATRTVMRSCGRRTRTSTSA